ncbi:MAG: hypothetical protein ABFD96_03315 [Armatimonadia bacterium]
MSKKAKAAVIYDECTDLDGYLLRTQMIRVERLGLDPIYMYDQWIDHDGVHVMTWKRCALMLNYYDAGAIRQAVIAHDDLVADWLRCPKLKVQDDADGSAVVAGRC